MFLESAGSFITRNVPTVRSKERVGDILFRLAKHDWDSISVIYILSENNKLLGEVPINKLVQSTKERPISELAVKPAVIIGEHESKSRIAVEAITKDLKSMPVEDKAGNFLGAVTAEKIIDVLHQQHIEDLLRSSGIQGRGLRILDLVNASIWEVLKARLPWLIVGLLIGAAASYLVSKFEGVLAQNTALAFFITMITYMSDSVGTQSETIFIRTQAIRNFRVLKYILREFLIGALMGGILGMFAGVFAAVISGDFQIGIILGLSLFLSMSISTVLACVTPVVLKKLKKDPAVGSGPFTTAIQDLVSVVIYFSIAMVILSIFR